MAGTPSFMDLFEEGRVEQIVKRADLAVLPGDVAEMIQSAGAAMGDRVLATVAERIKETFLGGAKGEALKTLVKDHWNIDKKVASKAAGLVTLSRPTAAAGAGTIPQGSEVATARDSSGVEVRFVTTAAVAFGATELSKTGVAVEASKAGKAGNVAAAKVTRVVTTSLFDQTLTVTNPARFAGGAEEESDEDLIDRVRRFPSTIRRGTLAALEYGALTVHGVARANANENETGLVNLFVTDEDGNSTGATVTAGPTVVDDGTMTKKVAVEIENWRAAGSVITVIGGVLLEIPVVVELTVRSGYNVLGARQTIIDSITGRGRRYQIGETVRREHIQQAVLNVDQRITGCNVISPPADIEPAPNEIPRFSTVSVT